MRLVIDPFIWNALRHGATLVNAISSFVVPLSSLKKSLSRVNVIKAPKVVRRNFDAQPS
jgi:hypothetical protein